MTYDDQYDALSDNDLEKETVVASKIAQLLQAVLFQASSLEKDVTSNEGMEALNKLMDVGKEVAAWGRNITEALSAR